MKITPYLNFKGQCEEAFRFYEKVLGGSIDTIFRFGSSPAAGSVPEGWAEKVMHARLDVGDQIVLGCDAPPDRYRQPQGFSVIVDLEDTAEAERVFRALEEGATVTMPFGETFWAKRFGMMVDRYGTPWMINVSKPA
jgi:PhnB protein